MDLYIYGAGGNGKELYNMLAYRTKEIEQFSNVYFIDRALAGQQLYGRPIFSIEEVLATRSVQDYRVIISPSSPENRLEIYALLQGNGVQLWDNVQDRPMYRHIGEGVVDLGCFAMADVSVGDACLLGTCATIAHDVTIGEGSYIGNNAFIGGGCKIGCGVLIAPGAILRHNIRIGDNATVAMGVVVLKHIAADTFVMAKPNLVMTKNKTIKNFD